MSYITKITILGERCSGTNYLEQLIKKNLNIEITWQYGHKHFFGFSDYNDSDHVLFIGIYRNLIDWLNSIYIDNYHLADHLRKNKGCSPEDFLIKECYSYYDAIESPTRGDEIMNDRNINTKDRYKNLLELRAIKMNFLVNDMKNKVKNYLLTSYEGLVNNWFSFILNIHKQFNIPLLNTHPLNHEFYKNNNSNYKDVKKKKLVFDYKMVKYNNFYNEEIEKMVGYKYSDNDNKDKHNKNKHNKNKHKKNK